MFPGGRVTIHPARLLLGTFAACALFTATASAQRVTPPVAQQDDRSDSPVLQQLARVQQQRLRRDNPIQDNPRARLEWQRRERGIPSADFKENRIRLRLSLSAAAAGRGAARPGTPASPGGMPVWVPIGPTDANWEQNGSATGLARDSGRARTILPHPTDPDTLYFLTSGGGLWVTHNFTANPPTWTPLGDSLVTTGGGAVAFGRIPSVLYLGLGDPFDLINAGGVMLKSVDGGLTWTNMVSLTGAFSVRDVKVDTSAAQDIVLVTTDFGLFRSTDGGVTYTAIGGGAGGVFQAKSLWRLAQTSAGWLVNAQPCSVVPAVACATQATIYVSTDHGATWAAIPNTGNVYTGAGRTTFGVGAPGDSIVYAFAENSASTDQLDLFRSTDGGLNWTALGIDSKVPTNPNTDNPNMDLMHDQSWYNQMILVDPRDAARNTIYLGGNLSSAKSTNGGNSWTLLSNWLYGQVTLPGGQPGMLPYAHADFHAAALSLAGTPTVMFGNDGGLFVSTNDGATWSSDKNKGLQTHLFYSLTSTPGKPSAVMAGSQDDGTRVREGNTTLYNQSQGGDGVGTGWSQANTSFAVTTVAGSLNFFNPSHQVPDLEEDFFSSAPPLINDAVFSTPMETPTAAADPSGKVFFTSSGQLIDKTTDGGWSPYTIIGQVGLKGIPSTITLRSGPHAVGLSPLDLLHVGVIASGGHVEITSDGGNTWLDRPLNTLVPGFQSFTESLTWADNQTIYVTSVAPNPGAVRVAKSTDGGATWARGDGGLPDVPTDRVIVDPRDTTHNTLLAASDLGVFRSTDGGASWAAYGAGLPNVHVSDIYMPPDGSFVRLATYGRGIWELPSLSFVSAALTSNVTSCNTNGALDDGGMGMLAVTLHNDGTSALNNVSATVTSTNPSITFPAGNTVNFPPAAASSDTAASIGVAMSGAVGIQRVDFKIAFTDPALNLPVAVTALASFRGNDDEIPNGSANDNIEGANSSWTVTGTAQSLPDVLTWQRRQITPVEHRWAETNSNLATDQSLISPVLHVGSGTFTFSFEQRYLFDFFTPSGMPTVWAAGMVLEISTDGGTSWTDIGAHASPGYDQVLTTGTGNVLGGRRAYAGFNANYPNFVSVAVNLGTLYAGQNVLIRFRVGTDTNGGQPGVEIRNITTTGLTNTPFSAVIAHQNACPTTTALTSSKNPSVFGDSVTFGSTVSGGLSTATGTATFEDGATAIGMASLDASGKASFTTAALAGGSHSIVAAYGGDTYHATSSSAVVTQVVNPAATSTALSLSVTPSVFGQAAVFAATVTSSPAAVPTGMVAFFDGAAQFGSAPLNGQGMATLSASSLSAGSHSITAAYGGDTNFIASTSTASTQVVNQAPTSTTVSSVSNPSSDSGATVFTANVSVTPPGGGTADGSVQFFDGAASLGTKALTGGMASLSVNGLAPGTHNITAVYSGSSNYIGSTSPVYAQNVLKKRRLVISP